MSGENCLTGHGTEVLAEWLKMDEDQIVALRNDSVVI